MKLFYIPNFDDKFYIFDKIESKHISKVLRLKNGNLIYFTDGKGKLYKAKIIDDNKKQIFYTLQLLRQKIFLVLNGFWKKQQKSE